jgi:hypothetical protein
MKDRKTTPIGVIANGTFAGLIGTATMDLVLYRRYKRAGGTDGLFDWEFSSGTDSYDAAAAPAQVGKRIVEGILQTELEPRTARSMNNVVHWATGVLWGATHGALAGSARKPRAGYGLATGTLAWLASYALLAPAKLYNPIWEYPGSVLAKDLSAHLAYGLGTGAAFQILVNGSRA